MNKVSKFEKDFSLNFHQQNIAFLISSKHLRKFHLGQVDIAKVELNPLNDEIKLVHLIELKYCSNPGIKQRIRLIKTSNYLAQVLDVETKFTIKLCKNTIDSLFY